MEHSSPSGTPVSAVLIGCGNIGSAYDEAGGPPLTHASALAALGVELLAVCDRDPERAATCAQVRGVDQVFTRPERLFEAVRADIVCIATPTNVGRSGLVELALAAGARGIFCEKPLGASLDDAIELRALVPDDFPFAVNYLRSFSHGLHAALDWVGPIEPLRHIVVRYDKGFANNGSHAIDLIRHFVGWPTSVQVLGVVEDGRDTDPTLDVRCIFEGGESATFIGGDHRKFGRFEVELVGDGGAVRFDDRGRSVVSSRPVPDPEYAGYLRLSEADRLDGALDEAIVGALGDLVTAISDPSHHIACTLDDALATMRTIELARSAPSENS